MGDIWAVIKPYMTEISFLVTFTVLLFSIFGLKPHEWWQRRKERKEAVERLVKAASKIEDNIESNKRLDAKLNSVAERIETVCCDSSTHEGRIQKIEELLAQHAKMIDNSLEERKLTSMGMLALLDEAIDKRGANGKAHAARDALETYLHDRAH